MPEPTNPAPVPPPLHLRLYVLGNTAFSDAAVRNLRAIAETQLMGRVELEVVDVRDEPMRALADGALAAPTLIVISERGNRRLLGDLSDAGAVLTALGLLSDRESPTDGPRRGAP